MQLVWFRNDLRLQDHPALARACAMGEPVTAVYCLTPGQWRAHAEAPVKLGLRQAALPAAAVGAARHSPGTP